MSKLFLVVCLVLFGSFAQAETFFTEYKTKVLEASDTQVVIADSPSFIVGASGIVSHTFDAKTKSIIARVDVIQKDGTKAILKVSKFDMLAQGAFPDTGIKPSTGDDVVINYLYDRALIVVPNQAVFNQVTKEYKGITWVHPDILAAYLAKLYRPNPDKKVLQQMCYQNAASVIFFGIDGKGSFVDCHNFNILQTIKIPSGGENELPFYSRISKHIDSSWFTWDSSKIGDYTTYYSNLIYTK